MSLNQGVINHSLNAIQKAEQSGWNLEQLVQYTLKNEVVTIYDDTITHFIKHRYFYLGYLKFEFYLKKESEPEDIDDYYLLFFKLSLLSENGVVKRVLKDYRIFYENYPMIFELPEWKQPIPELEEAVHLAIEQTLAPLDMTKNKGLLAYLIEQFIQDKPD
ncbi:MAG: hypothetical protein CMO01_10435 [Thalassobius sp.]|nr:hypothetical protein [Thalassovita sp.]